MEYRLIPLVALLAGCLSVPPDDGVADREGEPPDLRDVEAPIGPDAGEASCAGSFSVAYASRLTVNRGGGEIRGILLIQAITDGVDFTQLSSGDDSLRAGFALYSESYVVAAPGAAHGELCDAVEPLIVDDHVTADEWAVADAPSYGLVFDAVAPAVSTDVVRATLGVAERSVELVFEIVYQDGPRAEPVPTKTAVVTSTCPE